MATVQEQRDLLASYAAAQSAVRASSMLDMLSLWSVIDWRDLEATYPRWEAAVTTLIARDRARFEQMAADYLREAHAMAEASTPLQILTEDMSSQQVRESLRVTSIVELRTQLGLGRTLDAASQAAQVKSAGAALRLARDAAEGSVIRSSVASGGGWARVASPGACSFCTMLAGRGPIYRETTVRFASHDHCHCTAAASFGDDTAAVLDYTPSTRRISGADRARVRDWMRANPDA